MPQPVRAIENPSAAATSRRVPTAHPADALGAPARSSPEPAPLLDRLLLAEHEAGWRDRLGAFFASALVALVMSACHLTPDRIALNSLETVKVTAESSLRVAAALYNAGEITEAQWDNVVVQYKRVQAASKVAAAGVAFVVTEADAVTLVANAQRLLAELQKLVTTLQPKPVTWCLPAYGGVAWAS